MPSSKKVVNPSGAVRQAGGRTDLTESNAALAVRVLSDPSVFPDSYTSWIPRWIMANINFKITQQQLPSVGALHVVGATGEVAVFLNSWAYFGSNSIPSYYKDPFNRVFLNGIVKSGTVAVGSTGVIYTLSAGFRPQYKQFFAVASNGALGVCTVDVDGSVKAEVGSNVYFSMDGISFRQYQ